MMATSVKAGGRKKGAPDQAAGSEEPGVEFLPLRAREGSAPPAGKPLPTAKRPAHRPAYEATERDRKTVRLMTAGGIKQDQVADVLGISDKTLRKHFRQELTTALAQANAAVVASLYRMATTGNVHAAIWWTKARLGWSERLVVADGGPAPDFEVGKMSDEELAARIAHLSRPKPSRGLKRLPDDPDAS